MVDGSFDDSIDRSIASTNFSVSTADADGITNGWGAAAGEAIGRNNERKSGNRSKIYEREC